MSAYYNEFDPFAAAWLRELIKMGLIAPGDVDERSIADVSPGDLRGYAQCHFFAGIGGWSYAARLAGWPDDRPLWTGSCPCQPFSVAGKGAGVDDPRHLWPHFFRLISACRPSVVMGEQVAGKAGYGWLDGVRADLAGEDYASRGVDIPACAVDAPHIRSRLYWIAVADASRSGSGGRAQQPAGHVADGDQAGWIEGADRAPGGDEDDLVDPSGLGRGEGRAEPGVRGGRPAAAGATTSDRNVADAAGGGNNGSIKPGWLLQQPFRSTSTFWSSAEWIACHDGKARRAGSSLSVLVDGLPVGLADCRDQYRKEAEKAVLTHAESSNTRPTEVLSLVRRQYDPQAIRNCLGVPSELPTAEVLLDFLLGLAPALSAAEEQGDLTPTRDENPRPEVRSLRNDGEPVRPPRQRRSDGQPTSEQADALLELSLVLARCAEQSRVAREMAYAAPIPLLSSNVTNRVAKWRGFGNAIVPQVAAEVIGAFMDVEDFLHLEDLV